MPEVSLNNVSIRYGSLPVLDRVDLHVELGERICLIGRNGSGKTTLMKIITGEVKPDEGDLSILKHVSMAYLPQEVPIDTVGSIYYVLVQRLGALGEQLWESHQLSVRDDLNEKEESRLADLHHGFDDNDGWGLQSDLDQVLVRLGLSAEEDFNSLSAGKKRRVILESAFLSNPHFLLLDEPTNHLDIASIEWLEARIKSFKGSILFVTHDRVFLQNIATRIVEIDRGLLSSWNCSYKDYLVRKKDKLAAEVSQNAQFDKKLAKEEVWIRKGIQARRTRNEGRVLALKKLRALRAKRINVVGKAKLNLEQSKTSGQKVIDVSKLSYKYDDDLIIDGFSTTLFRGEKVGLIGANGCGKTTLINLLLKEIQSAEGEVKHGTNLDIAYFDQLRRQLDGEKTVAENINPNGDTISINGRNVHVMGYLQDFLFPPDRVRCKVRVMSGGERNRLLLAKLFSEPFNLLVLDEPTNDLDTETLELLEEKLIDYDGTLILVSHDRAFLNNVVTQCLVFEGNGKITESVGGYDDWLLYQERKAATVKKVTPRIEKKSTVTKKKLSFKEKRDLEEAPKRIEALEEEQALLAEKLNDPELYQKDHNASAEIDSRLKEIEADLEHWFGRWSELEDAG